MKLRLKMSRWLTAVGFLGLFIQTGCQKVVDAALFERHSVPAGSFRGIQIGSTMEATIESVRKLGAGWVHPIPARHFTLSAAQMVEVSGALDAADGVEGLRVQDEDAHAIVDLFFAKGRVARVRGVTTMASPVWFKESETKDEVLQELSRTMFQNWPKTIVVPVVLFEGDGRVELEGNPDPLKVLRKYQGWSYVLTTEKPNGAHIDLFFTNGRLSRLEYRRERIQIE
jgi:hypothetical protein